MCKNDLRTAISLLLLEMAHVLSWLYSSKCLFELKGLQANRFPFNLLKQDSVVSFNI